MEKVKIFDTEFSNLTMQESIEHIASMVKSDTKSYIVTPNVDHIVKLTIDKRFKQIYEKADLVLVDGMPLYWASHLLGSPLKEKVSGSDLFVNFMPYAAEHGFKIFLLGGRHGVAEEARRRLCSQYSNLKIVGTYSPPFGFENDLEENRKIIDMINASDAEILFVGLGAPKQEYWIEEHKNSLDKVKVSLGVGASFDFVAGTIKRAPRWMQSAGLEWFHRLVSEPGRLWRRYIIDDSRFVYIVLKTLLARLGFKVKQ